MNTTLNAAEKWLTELGIRIISHPNQLWVNRDDMVNFIDKDEQLSYDEMLAALKEGVRSAKIYWSGKNDDYLFLETL